MKFYGKLFLLMEKMFFKHGHHHTLSSVENVQINLQRNRLVRDHELVCRENEQLLRKLNLLLYKLNSMESPNVPATKLLASNPPPSLPVSSIKSAATTATTTSNLYTSSSSPSILSMLAYDDNNNNNLMENDIINDETIMDQTPSSSKSIERQTTTNSGKAINNRQIDKTSNRMIQDEHDDADDGQFLDLTIRGRSAITTVIHPKSRRR